MNEKKEVDRKGQEFSGKIYPEDSEADDPKGKAKAKAEDPQEMKESKKVKAEEEPVRDPGPSSSHSNPVKSASQ